MTDATTPSANAPDLSNRREYFRIDDVLPLTLRRLSGALPDGRLVPVSLVSNGAIMGGLSLVGQETDPTLTLLLLELESKLALLHAADGASPSAKDGMDGVVTVKQLLLRLNASVDHLLDTRGIPREDEAIRVSNVSLSGGGIKLETFDQLAPQEGIEVRMLINPGGEAVWVVVCGTVIRVDPLPAGGSAVAINFGPMSESVRDAIIHYALRKQKEQILSRG
ncbi:MAG: PilZ domain-containing protein [Thermodesulfobacteriota bacterium]